MTPLHPHAAAPRTPAIPRALPRQVAEALNQMLYTYRVLGLRPVIEFSQHEAAQEQGDSAAVDEGGERDERGAGPLADVLSAFTVPCLSKAEAVQQRDDWLWGLARSSRIFSVLWYGSQAWQHLMQGTGMALFVVQMRMARIAALGHAARGLSTTTRVPPSVIVLR